jgi:hypothetical protein
VVLLGTITPSGLVAIEIMGLTGKSLVGNNASTTILDGIISQRLCSEGKPAADSIARRSCRRGPSASGLKAIHSTQVLYLPKNNNIQSFYH